MITITNAKNRLHVLRTKLITDDDIMYEIEYLSQEKSIISSRILWCINRKSEALVTLPEDPAFERSDDFYQSEHYLELKARIAKGDYPDLSELESPEEMQLILPKLIESGMMQFNRETGEYAFPEEVQSKLDEMLKD